jgi:hypothetical protein
LKEIAKDFGTDACDGNTMLARETLDAVDKLKAGGDK